MQLTSQSLQEYLNAAAKQYDYLLTQIVNKPGIPRSWASGEVVMVPSHDWTSGFFPGSLWFLFEATGQKKWRDSAEHFTELLAPEQFNRRTHDIGFMLYCSYGNGLRLTGDAAGYSKVLLNGAAALSTRVMPTVGLIRSWDEQGPYPVIIDNMMNLELLLWASRESGNSYFRHIAVNHADRTLSEHFRPDGSCFHVVDYDPTDGHVVRRKTHQGFEDSSAWARGQAWALYGYTLMYRETRDTRYLTQAEKVAAFLINHPRLPADKVPYWDFDAPAIPNEPRDSSAAAIICSALLELSDYTNTRNQKAYLAFAKSQLNALVSPAYFAKTGTNGGFLLQHATGHRPQNSEIDVPINYGDYYFLEALLRAKAKPNFVL
ncbi:MAG: glycoside hydrolase family 88 protein [Nibricoccus sp.]